MNLPNRLTMVRIAVIPVFVVLMRFDTFWAYAISLTIFVGAAITDYFDGKIARKRDTITDFGTLLDPVADKILIAAAYICFLDKELLGIPSWVVVVIIGRELLVTGLRSFAASNGVVIGANKWGKLKAVSQMVCAITALALLTGRAALSRFSGAVSAEFLASYDQVAHLTTLTLVMLAMVFTVGSALRMFQVNRQLFATSRR